MNPSTAIKQFLDRVRRRRKGFLLVQGGLQVLAWGLAGTLIGNLIAYFSDNPRPFLGPFLIVWAAFLGIGLAAGIIPGLVIGAIGLITAIFSRGKNKRKAAASEEVLTAQLGEVIDQFKAFEIDLEGALTTIDQLFSAFQGQVKPLGKAGYTALLTSLVAGLYVSVHYIVNNLTI